MAIKLSANPDIRSLDDMRQVLYDKTWSKKAQNRDLYHMHRGIKRNNGLRYDITVIKPVRLGKEMNKTKGHVHCGDFKELYTVLEGRAFYLFQKYEKGKIVDVVVIEAKKGESALVPEGYGHVTINPDSKDLIMSNWAREECKSDYSLFEKKRGACYYYTEKGWVKNRNYGKIPALRFEKPMKKPLKNLQKTL